MRCDNCHADLSMYAEGVCRAQNHFCSVHCADRFDYQRQRPLELPQVSVLSAEDRATIDEARLWIRRLLLVMQDENLPGMEDRRVRHTLTLDGLERAGLYEVLEKLNALTARHAGEPQLANSEIRENGCAIIHFLLAWSLIGITVVGLLAFARGGWAW